MTIKDYLPPIVSLLYLITAIDFARQKEWAWCGMWFSYSLANIFLALAAYKK